MIVAMFSFISHFALPISNKGEETIAERNNHVFRLRTRSGGNCCLIRMWITILFIGRSRPYLSGDKRHTAAFSGYRHYAASFRDRPEARAPGVPYPSGGPTP